MGNSRFNDEEEMEEIVSAIMMGDGGSCVSKIQAPPSSLAIYQELSTVNMSCNFQSLCDS